jgi:hypothetical protein
MRLLRDVRVWKYCCKVQAEFGRHDIFHPNNAEYRAQMPSIVSSLMRLAGSKNIFFFPRRKPGKRTNTKVMRLTWFHSFGTAAAMEP